MHSATVRVVALVMTLGLWLSAAASAQSVGIGPRLTFARGSAETPDGTQRLMGGSIRLGGGRSAIELAMDYRNDVTGTLTERVKSYPFQGSLLLYPVRARVAPYVLGGVGWYSQRVTRFSAPTGTVVVDDTTTREMGFHAGFGAEVRPHRRFGVYGDYRYTKLGFGGDEAGSNSVLPGWVPGAQRLRLSHEGSLFTWGALIYF
jgi:opacity protein-like surface antigen